MHKPSLKSSQELIHEFRPVLLIISVSYLLLKKSASNLPKLSERSQRSDSVTLNDVIAKASQSVCLNPIDIIKMVFRIKLRKVTKPKSSYLLHTTALYKICGDWRLALGSDLAAARRAA